MWEVIGKLCGKKHPLLRGKLQFPEGFSYKKGSAENLFFQGGNLRMYWQRGKIIREHK